MRKTLILLTTILLIISCGKKENTTAISTDTLKTQSQATQTITFPPDDPSLDSTTYIGDANYFTETDEVYITLFYKPGLPKEYEAPVDSTIFDDGETKRQRVTKTAWNAFVLTGLKNIIIYNDGHQKEADAKLVRIELYDDLISSQYVAVYKAPSLHWNNEMIYYGVSENAVSANKDFSHTEYHDPQLAKELLLKVNKDTALTWISTHYKVMPANVTYTVMSCENESMILESKNEDVKILNDVKDDDHFDSLFPLPFVVGGKPAMLINASMPETDLSWNYLAEYKDGSYSQALYSRIKSPHK
jgi:hypothetical protein